MSVFKRIAFAASTSWLSRAISVLANIFFVPILFRHMDREELGLWFLLSGSQAFLGLLGFGIVPTLTRHIAFARASGAAEFSGSSDQAQQHVADLATTGRRILQSLAGFVFLVACVSGYGLVAKLQFEHVSPHVVLWAWVLMCAGYAINVWVSHLECWLSGVGYVGWFNLIGAIVALVAVLANIIAALLGRGIITLAVISVLAGLVQRVGLLAFAKTKPDLQLRGGRWNSYYAKALVKPALYNWITAVGAFLILRTDSYFIALYKGSRQIPTYSALYSMVSNVNVLAVTFGVSASVFVSQAWQAKDFAAVHRITIRNAQIGMSIMAAGVGFLMVAGRELIQMWIGPGNFLGYGILLVFCIMLTLESQHVILVSSSRATEDEKYAGWAIASGILNLAFTWYLIKPLGLLGVALGTMLAQLLTNNWYAVYRPLVRLQLRARDYFRQVIVLWAAVLAVSYGGSWLTKHYLVSSGIRGMWPIVIACAAVCGSVLLAAFWSCILDRSHRKRLQQMAAAKVFGLKRGWEGYVENR
jgi:O-antigen/teichoic acid export membrane protein